ncbi:MAG: hypothetical protein H0U46_02915 [Actinobacteria bacterium]|nr:hypothetical protein [Actinomycetota bacterium]
MANDRLLAIYLNDHLGGSAVAIQRCRYSAERSRGSALGEFLLRLSRDIEEDRETLLRVLGCIGAKPSSAKQAIGRIAERLGRLKPNGQLTGVSPLTPLVELEFLSLGVEGKCRLWVGLRELGDSRLAEFDFDALAERAVEQREGIEAQRLAAVRAAFR